ncbi:hypothetical protein H312_03088 [Anncaliia algerae PRA339]|uniref:Uncharacterized protein n=1 Tax=Anncaliia algerae PRA339 TaxID=1288291 RepID=A0A059EX84_9MICR|nr:hypothetical protein H312_03088 [Anncaliia algerae PRA339]
MKGYLPEIILLPTIFILSIGTYFINKISKSKRKYAYKSVGLPSMLKMLEKMEFKKLYNDEDGIRNNTFIKVSLNYINGKKGEIEKLFKGIFIEEFFCNNKYGIMLGSLLVNLEENRLVFSPSLTSTYAWYYLESTFEDTIKDKPILEYYFTLMKSKTFLMRDSRPYICAFAYDVEFDVNFERMLKNMWNRINNTSIIDKTFENNGVKFGKYLVLIFNNEIYESETNKFIKQEFKAYEHEFELLFLGVSDPDELIFDIYDKETGFTMQPNVTVCNFAIFKNLNYTPYESQSKKEERLKKEKEDKEREEKEMKEKEERERAEREKAERKKRKKEKKEREERKNQEEK